MKRFAKNTTFTVTIVALSSCGFVERFSMEEKFWNEFSGIYGTNAPCSQNTGEFEEPYLWLVDTLRIENDTCRIKSISKRGEVFTVKSEPICGRMIGNAENGFEIDEIDLITFTVKRLAKDEIEFSLNENEPIQLVRCEELQRRNKK